MKVVVQRVKEASVSVNQKVVSSIKQGYLLLVGFHKTDSLNELEYIARKIAKLRVFSDNDDKMNLSIDDVSGEILSISQFTLYGETHKSNRPSFTEAMDYKLANDYYGSFNDILRKKYGLNVLIGAFGENMDVSLVNDGPVTIIIEKNNQ
ncbi:MAG: D-tyrosyl-tRNA(Tyr) deacylase [Tenericutes bacterium]|nr:D-tyrosyl-tRNA(Tyr) deacylase [Mycoplasmatota bacterium]